MIIIKSNLKRYLSRPSYYVNTKDSPARELLVEAVGYLKSNQRQALDMGCGAGRDTKFLLEHGFNVTAVDANNGAVDYMLSIKPKDRLNFFQTDFESFEFGSYDLINASYCLPFLHYEVIGEVFDRIKAAIKPGGLFVGQLFGLSDEFNTPGETMTFLTVPQVERLLRDMEIIKLQELEYDGQLANGKPKHWHYFDIIARK